MPRAVSPRPVGRGRRLSPWPNSGLAAKRVGPGRCECCRHVACTLRCDASRKRHAQVYVEIAGGSGPERGASGRVRPERGGQSGKRGGASRRGLGRETERPREVLELRRAARRISMISVPHRASRTDVGKTPRGFAHGRTYPVSNCRTNAAGIASLALPVRRFVAPPLASIFAASLPLAQSSRPEGRWQGLGKLVGWPRVARAWSRKRRCSRAAGSQILGVRTSRAPCARLLHRPPNSAAGLVNFTSRPSVWSASNPPPWPTADRRPAPPRRCRASGPGRLRCRAAPSVR